jgi:hypothetical protein
MNGVDIGIKRAQKKVSLGILIVCILTGILICNLEIHK